MATARARTEAMPDPREDLHLPELPLEESRPPRPGQRTVPFKIHVTVKPAAAPEAEPLTEPEAIRVVLERAARDPRFIAELTYHGSQALAPYPLSWQAKAALLSGDIRWVEAKLGKLDPELRTWLDCRLQQEIW